MTASTADDNVRHYQELGAFFDVFASTADAWRHRNRGYHDLIENVYRFHVPPGRAVLEIGCGTGDLLAALAPARGVGVDLSGAMIDEARRRHPQLRFVQASGEDVELGETFDVVVLSDLVPYVHDLVTLFDHVRAHCRPETRVIINSYSRAWRPLIRAAEAVGAKPRKPIRNWVGAPDVRNLLDVTGFETITETRRIVLPEARAGPLPRRERASREHLAPQPPVRHVVGGRAPSPGDPAGDVGVDRRPVPERARKRTAPRGTRPRDRDGDGDRVRRGWIA